MLLCAVVGTSVRRVPLLLFVIVNAISPAVVVAITDISIEPSPLPPITLRYLRCASTLAFAATFVLYRLILAFSVDVLPDYDIGNPVILESRQVRLDLPSLNASANHLHFLGYALTARAIFPIFVND